MGQALPRAAPPAPPPAPPAPKSIEQLLHQLNSTFLNEVDTMYYEIFQIDFTSFMHS